MSQSNHATKRRKVRKGTQSCWECRRRKVRCIFSTSTNVVCDNCARRKTPCVSQESCESPGLGSLPRDEQLGTRLQRVERVIERLSNPYDSSQPSGHNDLNTHSVGEHSDVTVSNSPGGSTVALSTDNAFAYRHQRHAPSASGGFMELNRELIAAWPSQNELDLICALPVGLSSHLHCGVCRSHSISLEEGTPPIADLLCLPPLEAHPVLFARKLLILGTFLQGVLPPAVKAMEAQGYFPRQVMHRVVDTAIRFVTTRDELLSSVEAIECIVLEAMYHNYSGNLHRSWMATRRAITVAQSIALHRGFTSPSVRVLEPNSRREFDLDHMAFRLAELDAYLSVMLGLQRSSLETRHMTSEKALAACNPAERMQRIHYLVQERIIERSESTVYDLAESHEIDKVLRKAAAEMSPQWWLTPTFTPDNTDELKITHDMLRIMDQFAHYHLLLRLHLPYMLARGRPYDYSKVVAVNTSRELLNRFLSFRTSNLAHYYCRGSDFLAFVAATILCIAHIKNSGNASSNSVVDASDSTGFEFLAHSRLSDRGLMERILDVIETMQEPGTDAIASRTSRLLRDLLVIETSASDGDIYNVNSSEVDNDELECDGGFIDGGKAMRIHIPNFGSISFVKGVISRSTNVPHMSTIGTLSPLNTVLTASGRSPNLGPIDRAPDLVEPSEQAPHDSSLVMSFDFADTTGNDFLWTEGEDSDLQGVDVALFDGLFSGLA